MGTLNLCPLFTRQLSGAESEIRNPHEYLHSSSPFWPRALKKPEDYHPLITEQNKQPIFGRQLLNHAPSSRTLPEGMAARFKVLQSNRMHSLSGTVAS